MNKKTLGLVGGAVVIIIAVFLVVQMYSPGDSELESFTGSISDLLGSGRNTVCTFQGTDEMGQMAGTVYVSGENVRGDFEFSGTEGETLESHTIHDGEWIYVWGTTPMGVMGTKMKAVDVGDETQETGDLEATVPDFDERFDYKCRSWGVDSSLFVPPSDVEFQDLGALMEDAQKQLEQIPSVDCSACDQLPAGPAKDQCLQALGCN